MDSRETQLTFIKLFVSSFTGKLRTLCGGHRSSRNRSFTPLSLNPKKPTTTFKVSFLLWLDGWPHMIFKASPITNNITHSKQNFLWKTPDDAMCHLLSWPWASPKKSFFFFVKRHLFFFFAQLSSPPL